MIDPPPNQPIADALILALTRGMSLAEWGRLGMIEREWELYTQLAPHYGRLVVLSYGDPAIEAQVAARMSPAPIVVTPADSADAHPRVLAALAGARSVLIKTNQMDGVFPAARTAKFLRANGLTVALVGRGGYLRSRFLADQYGPASKQAADAAAEEHDLCAASDAIVGTTPEMVHALSWRYGVAPERTRVVPNYVIVQGSTRCAAEREPTVLYAGQLVARKRVDMLIRACACISDDNQARLTLSIIGEGPEEPALKALVGELGVNARFEKRLPHTELLERMRRAAIYAQASMLEGHPKAVIEAMACGAAVIVTDSPGMRDVLTHGVTGLRVEAHVGALADAIDLLLTDEPWREQMGHAAAHVAQEQYGLRAIVPLELAAHRQAMSTAGTFERAQAAGVRFDPALVDAADEAAGEWERSLRAFARRLESSQAHRVLAEVEASIRDLRESVSGTRKVKA